MLRWTQRARLRQKISAEIDVPKLSAGGKMAAAGIASTAIALLGSSAFDIQLGLPTFLAGAVTAILVLIRARRGPMAMLKNVSWGVLPLVAGGDRSHRVDVQRVRGVNVAILGKRRQQGPSILHLLDGAEAGRAQALRQRFEVIRPPMLAPLMEDVIDHVHPCGEI